MRFVSARLSKARVEHSCIICCGKIKKGDPLFREVWADGEELQVAPCCQNCEPYMIYKEKTESGEMKRTEMIRKMGRDVGKLCARKNAAYGNSFFECGEFLRLLYPKGVKPEQYVDMLAVSRIFDKLSRVATDKKAFQENPWEDICGYGILGAINHKEVAEDPEAEAFATDLVASATGDVADGPRQTTIENDMKEEEE